VIPIQPITIVSSGGTPMQLCDQKGAPYPTTGFGALVFNTGPTLIDAILLNPLITFDVIKLPGGDFYNPSLQFTADNSKTPGLYSTGPGNISLVGTNGDESSRALLASFDHPGNLHVANLLNIGGTIPPADSSTLVATTKWVNDQGYLTGTGAAGLYLPLVGGTLTGPLNITGAAGTSRGVTLMTAGLARWNIVATATAEGGGSAGSNLGINAFNDAGAFLSQPLTISRSTGAVTLIGALTGTTATFSGGELVGYGTAVPFQAYAGSTQTPLAQIATAGQASLSIQRYVGGGVATGPLLNFSKSQGSTAGTQAIAINTDMMGTLSFNASDGVKFVEGAYIRAEVDGAPGLNDMPGRLIFATSPDGSAAPAEAMRISNTKAVTLAGALTGTTATFSGAEKVMSATAIPAGGTAGAGYLFSSSTNFGMIFGSGVPTAAMARGSIYLRSDGGGPYVNTDGATTWAVMGGGGGASLTISDTPPGSPTAGAMWWNSVLGTLMVYYNDGNSSQWVPATPTMAGSYLPLTGGTLTGPLTGTTATFSGAAQALKLGVGMAPSLTATSNIWATGDITFNGTNHFIGGNLYYDSGWKYTANGTGGAVALAANSTQSFNVYTAPNNTGGAGAAATPFTALSFDAAGNPTFFGALTGTAAGLGLAPPANTRLTIRGTGTTTNYMIWGTKSDGSQCFNVFDSGQVDIYGPLSVLNGISAGGTVMAPGAQIQMVSVETGAVATGTTPIPFDDTIPQITEGDQYMTLAITPKSATSKLVIEVVWNGSHSVSTTTTVALFQDATANALAAVGQVPNAGGNMMCTSLRHIMTSGTTSATTFRVRAGGNTTGTLTFNGSSGARIYGGVMASSIVIREVAP
jgi:hypothetical protein